MRQDIVVARAGGVSESGHRYRDGRIGTKALRVVFDPTVIGDPANIPHHMLAHLVRRADGDGRIVDVFEPYSTSLAHRLVAVTGSDLSQQETSVEGNHD
jgi:hypothetical protein